MKWFTKKLSNVYKPKPKNTGPFPIFYTKIGNRKEIIPAKTNINREPFATCFGSTTSAKYVG